MRKHARASKSLIKEHFKSSRLHEHHERKREKERERGREREPLASLALAPPHPLFHLAAAMSHF